MAKPHKVTFKHKNCKRIVHFSRRKVLPLFLLIEHLAHKWNMKVEEVDW